MIKIAILNKKKHMLEKLHNIILEYSFRRNIEIIIDEFIHENELYSIKSNHDLIIKQEDLPNETIYKETVFNIIDEFFQTINDSKKYIILKQGLDQKIIKIKDILFIEAFGKLSLVHVLTENRVIESTELLASLEKRLDNKFCRCHRSCLVNLRHVISYNQTHAILITGTKVDISRRKHKFFEEKYNHLSYKK
ncbi:LytR/AlgR family response regulator transcription factor [Lachnospira multipara]|uniref:LytR/AlgR family response regulator transcription factor n=1 Tax=Lachnospira multipara TaxID=28051 RepID=UPI0004E11369|nr:LytTR family DNA-binding domain-containing protein [Lachnospira multipara]